MKQLTNPSPYIGLVTTVSVQAQTETVVKERELEMGL
jgi:hypothetical protein